MQVVQEEHGLTPRQGPEGQVILEAEGGEALIPRLIAGFTNGKRRVEISSVNLRRPTLEDVFIKLTGRAIRAEEADEKERFRRRSRMFGRMRRG